MNTFWEEVKEMLDDRKAKIIVEVGALDGLNTRHLLNYLKKSKSKKAKLIVVDVNPLFDAVAWEKKCKGLLEVIVGKSVNALLLLKDYDAVLLDGDHEETNVLAELKIIDETFKGKNTPLILLHDTVMIKNPDSPPTGVMKAIQTFLKESEYKWNFKNYDKLNGLGVLTLEE